jgi:hypothetical protein
MEKYEVFHDIESRIKTSRESSWQAIRQKNVKDLLIEKFVIGLMNAHGLSVNQGRALSTDIALAITFKIITPQHITYEGGVITAIEGVSYDETNQAVLLDRSIYSDTMVISREIPAGKKTLKELWPKHLKSIHKKRFVSQ